jgi:tetratricopeptide (TPR) repeat protein
LAQRAGYRCSNPGCQRATVGAAPTKHSVINIGAAAHLTAAAPGGPRYDPSLTADQRRGEENGIWLCRVCADFIDDDPAYYSLDLLRSWKEGAEGRSFIAVVTFAGVNDEAPICMAPLERLSRSYMSRGRLSSRITERFKAGANSVVLTGPGGVGKTQLALHYASSASAQQHVFWLMAEDDASLLRSWRNAAQLIGIEGAQWIPTDELEFRVFSWLRTHRNWLAVFDNFEPDHVGQLSRWLLLPPTGKVLITSREQEVTRDLFGAPLHVPPFTEHEGIEFLLQSSGQLSPSAEDREAIGLIARLLHGLPLALEQAAVAARGNADGYSGYLKTLESGGKRLLRGSLEEALDRGIGEVTKVPGASTMLSAMSFLAPDAIEGRILKLIIRREGTQASSDVEEALAALRKFSLIENVGSDRYAIHRLVQSRIRETLPADEAKDILSQSIDALLELHPQDPENIENRRACASVLPHVLAVHGHSAALPSTPSLALLFEYAGRYADAAGLFESAEALLEAASVRGTEAIGEYDERVLAVQSRLAGLYRRTGRLGESRKAYRAVIERRMAKRGRTNEFVAITYNNLGNVYYDDGDLRGAEKAYREATAIWEALGTPESADAALTMNGLANVLRQQKEWDEAENLYRNAIHIWRDSEETAARHLGFAQNGLGNLLLARGDIDEAIEQYFAADLSWSALGGEPHPDRGYALHNLGRAYAMLGDEVQARAFYGQALQIREHGLGQRHPLYTLTRAHLTGLTRLSDGHPR